MRDVLVRVLALAVAVGMVVGALALRDRFGDTGEPEARPTVDGPGPTAAADGITLLCSRELASVCELAATDPRVRGTEVLDGVDELEAAVDAVAAAAGPYAVITLEPVATMVDERRDRAGRSPLVPVRAATDVSSPVVLVIWEERLAALEAHCGSVEWTCLGDVAGSPWTDVGGDERWGAVSPGYADPGGSLAGLLATSQALAGRVGDVGFSLRDLQTDAVRGWFTRLERAVPSDRGSGDLVRRMLTQGRAALDAAAVLEAEAARLLPVAGTRAEGLVVRYLDPWIEARVVVAGADEPAVNLAEALLVDDAVRTRLLADGWRLGDAIPSGLPQAPAGPDDRALPSAGALEALLSLQAEVVR